MAAQIGDRLDILAGEVERLFNSKHKFSNEELKESSLKVKIENGALVAQVWRGDSILGNFAIQYLPPGIAYFFDVWVGIPNKGIGRALLHLRQDAVRRSLGHIYLFAVVRKDNAVEQHLLTSEEWRRIENPFSTSACSDLWVSKL